MFSIESVLCRIGSLYVECVLYTRKKSEGVLDAFIKPSVRILFVYTHARTHTYVYTHARTHTYVYICMCTYMHVCVCVCVCVCARVCVCMRIYICIYIYMYIIYVYMHMHTHTHSGIRSSAQEERRRTRGVFRRPALPSRRRVAWYFSFFIKNIYMYFFF